MSWVVAEYDIDNDFWIQNKVNLDLPFFPFSSIVFCPDSEIYVTGGLNDILQG